MSLNVAANNANTGLAATSKQAQVTANNIANVNTEGYDRREARLESVAIDGKGGGVRVASVDRAQSLAVTADRRRSDAEVGEQAAISAGVDRISQALGGPDDPTSLFAKYEALETALRSMADQPESTLARNSVLVASTDLADAFNTVNSDIQRLRQDVDDEIARQVAYVNEMLVEIDELNEQVSKTFSIGQNPTEYEAQRDALIDKISSIVPLQSLPQNDGQVFLATTTGAMLLTSNAAEFEFTAAGVITADMDYRGGAPGSLSGLTLNGGDITPDDTGVQSVVSGSLRGLFEVRDVLSLEFQDQIDALAEELITRFDAAEPAGSIPVGEAGLFTDNQVASTGAPGLAGRLQVNDLVIPPGGSLDQLAQGVHVVGTPVAGDNDYEINLLEALTNQTTAPAALGVTGVLSASDMVAEFGSIIFGEAQFERERLSVRSAQNTTLVETEAEATGVDLDYELQNLTLIQTAYAANARVLQVVDEMLRTLLEI